MTTVNPTEYVRSGFALVPFPRGLKGPEGPAAVGWNLRENCITTEEQAARLNGGSIGLAHAYCMPTPTGVLDVDKFDAAAAWLDANGCDLSALLMDTSAVQIRSGRPGRAKALYRLPEVLASLVIKDEDGTTALEFRCASAGGLTVQDVLPPSIHPTTGKPYEWIGDWRSIPDIPAPLLGLWRSHGKPHGARRDDIHIVGRSAQAAASGRAKLHIDMLRLARECPREAGRGVDRSGLLWKIINHMVSRGATDVEIVSVLTDPALGVSAKALAKGNPAAWICGQIAKARAGGPLAGAECNEPPNGPDGNCEAPAAEGSAQASRENEPPEDGPSLGDDGYFEALEEELRKTGSPQITEDSLAVAFVDAHGHELRFDHDTDRWFVWGGVRWRMDGTDLAFDLVRHLVRTRNTERVERLARAKLYAAVERICRADRICAVTHELWDRDPWLLNTPGGTFDLRTGAVRTHDPRDYITKCTAVAPESRTAPTFERFLRDITCGDTGLAEYLQRALGACLSGAIADHWLMFWYGAGRNGKNTLGDLVLEVLGDYAKLVPTQTLMADPHGNRHPTEIANLRGLRLAISSEVAEGEHWHETRLKELTGDAVLSGRFMRQDFFTFARTHKHVIFGNHRPLLRIVDPAIAARLHLVPFNAHFDLDAGTCDPDMPAKLRAEAGAVLQWLIDGHEKWREAGTLYRCTAVQEATQEYLCTQATMELWIAERCAEVPDDGRSGRAWLKASELYRDYVQWKTDRGEHALSQTRWGEQMSQLFRKITADGVRYVGLLFASRSV
jgi:putative DNA primase/helicase